MKKLIAYLFEKFGKSNRIQIDDPIMLELVHGVKRRAIILALFEGKQN